MQRHPFLFDLDGTLVDSLADIAASVNHIRQHLDLTPLPVSKVREMVGDGAQKLFERALRDAPADTSRTEVWALYQSHHKLQCTQLVSPYPGVRERLEAWHAAGHPMAVVTNKPETFALQILEHLDLAKFFGCVIGGDTLPQKKPAPEPVLEALRRLSQSPDAAPDPQALMVGDGTQDIQAGKAAGIRTAAVLFGFRSATILRQEDADEYWPEFGHPEPCRGDM